jgi:hypothetical protein
VLRLPQLLPGASWPSMGLVPSGGTSPAPCRWRWGSRAWTSQSGPGLPTLYQVLTLNDAGMRLAPMRKTDPETEPFEHLPVEYP